MSDFVMPARIEEGSEIALGKIFQGVAGCLYWSWRHLNLSRPPNDQVSAYQRALDSAASL